MRRRPLLWALPAAVAAPRAAWPAAAAPTPTALPALIRFPRDHGAHPGVRTEWWYITGAAREDGAGARDVGFQITFFRTRVPETQAMSSRFAARQLIFAHAAVTDVQGRKLHHDQRIAREGFGIADAAQDDGAVRLRDWSLRRGAADGAWTASAGGNGFALALRCVPTQAPLLQGAQGLSRKGPDQAQASLYYSEPQLAASGTVTLQGRSLRVRGKAWMDHEWSDNLLHPQAVGWDWIGMNLDDGSALTAFRLRRKDGTTLWDGGSFRTASGVLYTFSEGEVAFSAQRRWTSALSQASYPVEWMVRTPADIYTVRAVLDDQELDSRASTGAIYWEGLCELFDSNGKRVGRGYLEMTGYAQPLRL